MQASAAAEASVQQAAAPVSTRRAWHITKQGDMQSLRLVKEPVPILQPGEVLVEVRALGLNFAGKRDTASSPTLLLVQSTGA